MCTTQPTTDPQQPTTNAAPTTPPPSDSDTPQTSGINADIHRANLELQLAQLQANASFNSSPAGQMLRQFETYQRIAKPLSESIFVPSDYRGNIGNCVIAVEMAARLGVFPLTVMQNLCIVKGNPTWKSRFLIGCVNTCGRYTTLDYHITIDGNVGPVKYKTWQKDSTGKNHEILLDFDHPDLDNLVCTAFATEKATGKLLTSPPVSIRMAIQEGWYTKDGSKWPTMPDLMLRYRAASQWVSTYAPEMSMGFRTVEEERDIEDVEYEELHPSVLTVPRSRPTSTSAIEQAKERLRTRQSPKNDAQATDTTTPSSDIMP